MVVTIKCNLDTAQNTKQEKGDSFMRNLVLIAAIALGLLSFAAPAKAQYWPDMRDFKVQTNQQVQDARVAAALKEGKYRSEIDSYRKLAFSKAAATPDLFNKISVTLSNLQNHIDGYLKGLQSKVHQAAKNKEQIKNPYGLMEAYKEITTFSEVSLALDGYLTKVEKCNFKTSAVVTAANAAFCKKVISAKTFGYAKIMEVSFNKHDNDTFFNAKQALDSNLK